MRLLIMVHGLGRKRHSPNVFLGIDGAHADLPVARTSGTPYPRHVKARLVSVVFQANGFAWRVELPHSAQPRAGVADVQCLNGDGKRLAFVVESVNARWKFLLDPRRSTFPHGAAILT